MARIRTSTQHHRGWSPRQMEPDQIARDIALAIRAAKAVGTVLVPSDFTHNPLTQQRVCDLLNQ